jgi:UDP-3-O-[3-hydroxymyristoyl] N-acetylglucosamine deacetylase
VSWADPSQGTLAQEVRLSGVGIHTGQTACLTLRPAPVDRGRVFITGQGLEIPARIDFVTSCDRATILGRDGARVSTPEHLLSALAAFGIDNLEMHIEGEEVPILDGSALPFWEALRQAGRTSQGVPAKTVVLGRPLAAGSADGPLVVALPSALPSFEYVLYYPHPMLGAQTVACDIEDDYGQAVAPARTFALWEEVQALLDRGMALGGSLDNALVVHQDRFSTPLRLPQEPARHKLLDLIGDFALLDARLQARVLGIRAGHRWHIEAARKVWEETQ